MSPVSGRQRALCGGQMLGQNERFCRRPKLAWRDYGHNQVGVGLRAFWKYINDKRVTEKELRWELGSRQRGCDHLVPWCTPIPTWSTMLKTQTSMWCM